MSKIEETITRVLNEIRPLHTERTYVVRKTALMSLLRFAEKNGYTEPSQELYDAFTAGCKATKDSIFRRNHAVRLVDKASKTFAKDRTGRFYNEPPLPSYADAKFYFETSGFPVVSDTDIGYLIVYTNTILGNFNLSKSTMLQYRHALIDLRRFFYDNNSTQYKKSIVIEYIDKCRSLYEQGVMKYWKWKINRKASQVIMEIAETGSFKWHNISTLRILLNDNDEINNIVKQYIDFLKTKELEKSTIELYKYVIIYAFKHCDISTSDQVYNMSNNDVYSMINGFVKKCNNRSISTILPILRSILIFLFNNGYVKNNLSNIIMPVFVQRNHLPQYIHSDLDAKILDGLSKESRRNRAMILLAYRLGLRDIDICNLMFQNIDWKNDKITVIQKKTDNILTLPLLPDIGNAVMDYIINDRPNNSDKYPYIFRRIQAPYNKLTSMYYISFSFFKNNNIETANGTSKGTHVFRYTLANRMLKAKIPHHIITETLGHKSKESDKPYISMDKDMLRMCPLDLSMIGTPQFDTSE